MNTYYFTPGYVLTFEVLKLEVPNKKEHVFLFFLGYLTQYHLLYFHPFTYIKFMISITLQLNSNL